jgi:murein hydrolase activator
LKLKSTTFRRFNLILLLVLVVLSIAYAQRAKRDLERKRRRLLEAMQQTKSELVETRQEKKSAEKNYAAIQGKIEQKENKIDQVSEVISNSSEIVERNYQVINDLSNDLISVKSDYGEIIRKGFRQKLNKNLLAFLFSADSFNELIKRFHYLRQIDRFRKKQVRAILDTRDELENRIVHLEQNMAKNADALAVIQEQKEDLDQKLDKTEDKLSGLKSQEHKLNRELQKQEVKHEKLSAAIDAIIKAEIEERVRSARAAADATRRMRRRNEERSNRTEIPRKKEEETRKEEDNIVIKEAPEVRALSDNFRNNRGKLPWPVRSGAIVRKFGRQPHPTLHNIMTSNNGIDIQTLDAADVSAVFAGKVVAVQFIPGSNYLIIVQHGSYYTVYSNLDRTYVHKGDEVSLRQSLGKVSGNTVHFELWQNRSRENPSGWIAK